MSRSPPRPLSSAPSASGLPPASRPARALAKPVIFCVDDETEVLNAVARDLRKHLGGDYRIMKASSGAETLDAVRELKSRDQAVALFLVDQRMPVMSGTELLVEAAKLYPDARKVLLTAYADTEAAIESINTVGLDHYLMKPWDPPEELLYPVLEDTLADWHSSAHIPYDGVRVAGAQWSARSHEIKEFLARNGVPYRWLDIEADATARELVGAVGEGSQRLPVVFLPGGQVLIAPERAELADALGMRRQAQRRFYDLVVVGAGPAGLAAAVYGSCEGLKTILLDKEATGGQAGTSSRIENYLGFPKGISGADLARRATAQAQRLGTEILVPQEVTGLRVEDPYRIVTLTDGSELSCYAVILAMGVAVRRLELPGIDRFTGVGVFYGAALTEAASSRGKQVFLIGGANSAGQGAMFFSRYASKVTMLVRGDGLQKSMSQYLIEQIADTPNIEVVTHTLVAEVKGEERLETLVLEDSRGGERREVPGEALFIFIGAAPLSGSIGDLVQRDDGGYIVTGDALRKDGRWPRSWTVERPPMPLETSVPGVFASGDVRAGSSKRVAAAVGEGSVAVQLVHRYLETV